MCFFPAEIEEKEDQMTKLYKQLDTKNMEVMKYKTLSDKAKVTMQTNLYNGISLLASLKKKSFLAFQWILAHIIPWLELCSF